MLHNIDIPIINEREQIDINRDLAVATDNNLQIENTEEDNTERIWILGGIVLVLGGLWWYLK